ncbi:MAG: cupin domain-containing protein [Thermoanaerobaculia bacterium]
MRSKVLRAEGFRWPEVPLRAYADGGPLYRDVTRQEILGRGAGEQALAFETRYFEVAPGGFSSFERHDHPHAVVVVRGRGEVRLGAESFALAPFDAVYVAPGEAHQFRAAGDEPFGFLCMVDRERDRPVPVDGSDPAPADGRL